MPLRSKVTVFKDEDRSRCKGRIIVINDEENPFVGRRTSSSKTEKSHCARESTFVKDEEKLPVQGEITVRNEVQKFLRATGRLSSSRTEETPPKEGESTVVKDEENSLCEGRLPSSRTRKIFPVQGEINVIKDGENSLDGTRGSSSRTDKIPCA